MIHVSGSCNPNFHATGAHYINADTIAFMQLMRSDLFRDFPTLKFIIPHGGGAVPYHWGRYRGSRHAEAAPAAGRARDEQRVLRHLRLPPARHRPAASR
jgi:4-oxalmesaconate hydratase